MLKITKIISSATLAIMLAGCGADNGLAVNTIGTQKVVQNFRNGYVISTKKVLVSKSMTSTLLGATTGAIGGTIADKSVKGAVVGTAIGGLVGYVGGLLVNNNEVEAYETKIKSNNMIYTTYLVEKLNNNEKLEFVVRDSGKITNIKVL